MASFNESESFSKNRFMLSLFSGLYPKAKSHFFTQDGYIKEDFSYICSITFTAFTISQLIVRDNKIYSRSCTAVIV